MLREFADLGRGKVVSDLSLTSHTTVQVSRLPDFLSAVSPDLPDRMAPRHFIISQRGRYAINLKGM